MTTTPTAGKQTTLLIVGAVLLALGAGLLWRGCRQRQPSQRVDTKRYQGIGTLIGEAVARKLGDRTPVVVVHLARPARFLEALEKGFADSLRAGQLSILSEEAWAVLPDPANPAPLLDRAGYQTLLQKYPTARAVLLVGSTPHLDFDLTGKVIAEWPVPTTPLIPLVVTRGDALPFLNRGVSPWAIVYRYESTGTPATPRDQFDRDYQILEAGK